MLINIWSNTIIPKQFYLSSGYYSVQLGFHEVCFMRHRNLRRTDVFLWCNQKLILGQRHNFGQCIVSWRPLHLQRNRLRHLPLVSVIWVHTSWKSLVIEQVPLSLIRLLSPKSAHFIRTLVLFSFKISTQMRTFPGLRSQWISCSLWIYSRPTIANW